MKSLLPRLRMLRQFIVLWLKLRKGEHQDVKLEKTSGSARRPLLTSERLKNEVSAK